MGFYSRLQKASRAKLYTDKELFHQYFQRVRPYLRSIVIISIIIFFATLIDIANPLLVGNITDQNPENLSSYAHFLWIGGTYFALSTVNWVFFYLRRRELGHFVPHFLKSLRMEVFDAIQAQDMAFFDKFESGQLNSRVTNDTLDFSNTTFLIAETAGNFLISVLTIAILFWLNPILAAITVGTVPLIFLVLRFMRTTARKVSRPYRLSIAEVNSSMVEAIEGIHVSKSYGQEASLSEQFMETNQRYRRNLFHLTAVTHTWRPILDSITAITLVIVMFVGSSPAAHIDASPGTMLMYILYLQRFFRPVIDLSTFIPQLSSSLAAFERILEIIDSKPSVVQTVAANLPDPIRGEITFDHVDFQYDDDSWIFQNFNLHIQPGERLAVVGATGAGKTSLVGLLSRYYEFQQGDIAIDGASIRSFPLKDLRDLIGKVEQDVFLFHGTIEDNLRYSKPEATEADLRRAIETVHADEFLDSLPHGLQTVVGERGKGLSAGQRQLLSFARALLTDPKILVLDEATSSVDAFTESLIQDALDILFTGRTSIVVAHRLSTIVNADRIIVMDHGQIVEEGSHQALLALDGRYADLYHQYFEYQKWD